MWRYYSTIWFILSIWSSIWGWNNIDNHLSRLRNLNKAFQKCEMKMKPWSEIIEFKISWNRITWSRNILVNWEEMMNLMQEIRWHILMNLSTNTRIQLYSLEIERSTMRSQVISFQKSTGTGREASSSCLRCHEILSRKQRSYVEIYFLMYMWISGK